VALALGAVTAIYTWALLSASMRFVRIKLVEQQGQLMQHRTRDLLMRQRTQTINALCTHLAELGITAAQGREGLKGLLAMIADEGDDRLPVSATCAVDKPSLPGTFHVELSTRFSSIIEPFHWCACCRGSSEARSHRFSRP
jgi:hypothetical protein